MIKNTDILSAINLKIKSKFTDIPILSESDVKERIVRPSFMTTLDNLKTSDFMSESLDREMTIKLYYFPTDRDKNKIELLNMIDDLYDLFLQDNIINIDTDFAVEVEELEVEIIDKVLHCYFDLMMSEDYNREDNTPNMEDLQFTQN